MSDYGKLPRGIRNNNPGNMREAVGIPYKVPKVDGFACFETPLQGMFSLLCLFDRYIEVHRWVSVYDFVTHYAPSSENDTNQYIKLIMAKLGKSGLEPRHTPTNTSTREGAMLFAKIITHIENGMPLKALRPDGQWYTDAQWYEATRLFEISGRSWTAKI